MSSIFKLLVCAIYCFFLTGCNLPVGQQNQNKVQADQETNLADPTNNTTQLTQAPQLTDQIADNQNNFTTNAVATEGEDTDFNLEQMVANNFSGNQSTGNSVPTVIQSNYENCGPASLTSVLNYHGASYTQSQIAAQVTNGNGSTATDLISYARSKGFTNSTYIPRQANNDTMRNLQSRVAQRPQIVTMGPVGAGNIVYDYPKSLNPQKNWNGDFYRSSPNHHFVVVQSFTPEGNPVLMDPARAELGRVVADRNWFERHWKESVDIS